MTAAEKRVRAYFKNSSADLYVAVTTGEGHFAMTHRDVVFLAGERRRVAREIAQEVAARMPGTKTARLVAEICKEIGAK